jgi:DNA-binding LytR/AlgR family response regulator
MIRVLLIEDEQPAAKRLSKMITEIASDFEIIQVCDSIESAVSFLKIAALPDLIFLDIQLGDGISFEIFKQIEVACPVIFTTAYDEYIFRAFELNSIDYLMKPIHKEELARSVDKFRKLNQAQKSDWQFISSLLQKENAAYKQRFLVSSGANLITVKTTEVAYFYSVERSTFLTSTQGKSYALDFSLDKLEEMLSPKEFFRVNRQFLVSLSAIKKINVLSKSRMKIILEPLSNDEVFVSNARAHEFRIWLDK